MKQRRLRIESLETRRMLAADPQLISRLNNFGAADPRDFIRTVDDGAATYYFLADQSEGVSSLFALDQVTNGPDFSIREIFVPALTVPAAPDNLTLFNNEVYFTAAGESSGQELWKLLDSGEPELVKDINPGEIGSFPTGLHVFEDELFFSAFDFDTGRELWKTDGTGGGTERVADINPGIEGSFPTEFAEAGGELFFRAGENLENRELWKTDGSGVGTVQVKDINPNGNGDPHRFASYKGELFFSAVDEAGRELWKSDGTEAGTARVADILDGSGDSTPDLFFEFNDDLYFIAVDQVIGENRFPRLWRTDGTSNGTAQVTDLPLASLDTIKFQNRIFFSPFDADVWGELHSTDGTSAGTELIRDIAPSTVSSTPGGFVIYGDELYFSATSPEHGRELWRTNGTSDGTVMVKDIHEGVGDSNPEHFIEYDGDLYFVADDSLHGREIWRTDGTADGTVLVMDIFDGEFSSVSDPKFQRIGQSASDSSLIFSADNTQAGEIWIIPPEMEIPPVVGFPGDADLDENVTFNDFLVLATNFGKADAQFVDGDFNSNGTVDFGDFLVIAAAFGRSYEVQFVTINTFDGEQLRYRITGFRSVFQDGVPNPGQATQLGSIDFDGTVTSFDGFSGNISEDGVALFGNDVLGELSPSGSVTGSEGERGIIGGGEFTINGFGTGNYTGSDIRSVAALVFFQFFFPIF